MNKGAQLPLDLGHRPALGREDFLISSGNELAVKWIDRWPDWPGGVLVLQGPRGSGKSHLAAVWQGTADALEVAGDELLTANPLKLVQSAGSLVLEDVERKLLALPGGEVVLFHLINAVRAENANLLLTARSHPKQWELELADLRSRVLALPFAQLGPLDDLLMEVLLVKLFHDRQLRVEEGLVRYAVQRMERSAGAARDLVEEIDKLSLAERRDVTIPLVRRVLGRKLDT